MNRRRTLSFVPLDRDAFYDRWLLAQSDELTLGELLHDHPAFSLEPLEAGLLELRVRRLNILLREPDPRVALYPPPGMVLDGTTRSLDGGDGDSPPADVEVTAPEASTATASQAAAGVVFYASDTHPEKLGARDAVLIAHDAEITYAARFLESGLSVLIQCEKLLVQHLATEIAHRAGLTPQVLRAAEGAGAGPPAALGGGRRQVLLDLLQQAVNEASSGDEQGGVDRRKDVIVVPHLDLLAGGSDASLTAEARELSDVLYDKSGVVLLAFTDPSLNIPEVLANRFAVRLSIEILPRVLQARSGPVPVGTALVTREEAELFKGYNPVELYKHVAGLNAVRLRHAMRFALRQHAHERKPDKPPSFDTLIQELRTFKAKASRAFEVPRVELGQIGGYQEVKDELVDALTLMSRVADKSEAFRNELVPRGFIFHGPPGTGKTLFAKAVATLMNATIVVVSGPEITDMYVGESERKLREIFSEARRNAPTVLVFDEFDSIASRRSGRDDGGNRANNAMVAQMLTEMDGFRPEVPVLVIGTTNRLDIIDEALLRPSRFKPIRIDLPNELARREIAKVHRDHFDVQASDTVLGCIATATENMNGDEIGSIFRTAKADEYLDRPKADARRFGELVGNLRHTAQERDLERSQQNPGAQRAGGGPRSRTWNPVVLRTGNRRTAEPSAEPAAGAARERSNSPRGQGT